jgi:hypothetical protein
MSELYCSFAEPRADARSTPCWPAAAAMPEPGFASPPIPEMMPFEASWIDAVVAALIALSRVAAVASELPTSVYQESMFFWCWAASAEFWETSDLS